MKNLGIKSLVFTMAILVASSTSACASSSGLSNPVIMKVIASGENIEIEYRNISDRGISIVNNRSMIPSDNEFGVSFVIIDVDGKKMPLCAMIHPDDDVVVHLRSGEVDKALFSIRTLSIRYCLAPGKYYLSAYLNQVNGRYMSNEVAVTVVDDIFMR